ncbi:hypothetical protein ACFC1L_39825 [Streptomyces sp. NPDC056210]|uniref:hypothetical protein n=1 Tax=Streptomyces sp. NPDC056210 TaxID=3345746 RepID=UPI0035DC98F4
MTIYQANGVKAVIGKAPQNKEILLDLTAPEKDNDWVATSAPDRRFYQNITVKDAKALRKALKKAIKEAEGK